MVIFHRFLHVYQAGTLKNHLKTPVVKPQVFNVDPKKKRVPLPVMTPETTKNDGLVKNKGKILQKK